MKKTSLCCLAVCFAATFPALRAESTPRIVTYLPASSIAPTPNASTPNLLLNPSFESGNADYTLTNGANSDFGIGTGNPHTGNNALYYDGGTRNSPDVISQTIGTTQGSTYTVSFWLASLVGGDNQFQVTFGTTALTPLVNIADSPYTQYFYTAVATGNSTTVSFAGYEGSGTFSLDDVAVNLAPTPVPEPSTWALLGLGAVGVSAVVLRRRARA